jgi:hypothetical protein
MLQVGGGARGGERLRGAGLPLLLGMAGLLGGCRTSTDGLAVSDSGAKADERAAVSVPDSRPTVTASATADAAAGAPADALAGPPPSADGGPAAACAVGQVHCTGLVPQTCGADGTWLNGPPCAYACQGGCVNRFAAVSSGRGSPTNGEGLAEFARNTETFFSERGGLFGARGFNVAVMDPRTGATLEPVKNFDPWTTPLSGNALSAMADYLEALEPGRLVLIATCDDAGITRVDSCEQWDTAPVQRLLTTLRRLGSQQIDAYCFRGAWSLVTMSGSGPALAEKLSSGPKVTAEVMLPAMR